MTERDEWTKADRYEWRREGDTVHIRPTAMPPTALSFTLPATALRYLDSLRD